MLARLFVAAMTRKRFHANSIAHLNDELQSLRSNAKYILGDLFNSEKPIQLRGRRSCGLFKPDSFPPPFPLLVSMTPKS